MLRVWSHFAHTYNNSPLDSLMVLLFFYEPVHKTRIMVYVRWMGKDEAGRKKPLKSLVTVEFYYNTSAWCLYETPTASRRKRFSDSFCRRSLRKYRQKVCAMSKLSRRNFFVASVVVKKKWKDRFFGIDSSLATNWWLSDCSRPVSVARGIILKWALAQPLRI